jgi:hypothetical protein
MRKFLVTVAVGCIFAAAAVPAGADHVRPHRHFIITPSGQMVEVGPRFCDMPETGQGFDQFHANVHMGHPQEGFANPNNPVVFVTGPC